MASSSLSTVSSLDHDRQVFFITTTFTVAVVILVVARGPQRIIIVVCMRCTVTDSPSSGK
jgi:hypothetical protein